MGTVETLERPRRIGILTGGGDVPGLNSVIKSCVYRSTELGFEVIGIRRGWEGLTHMRRGPDLDRDYLRKLDRINTRTIDRTGGTMLHTSRTNPRRMRQERLPSWMTASEAARYATGDDRFDLTPRVLENIEELGLAFVIVIGGDDTLAFAHVLHTEGVPVVAIPKTMDNDVPATEYCIGFSSAVTRGKELINRQRTTLGSHERIGIFRMFGRDAGFTALFTAYVTSGRCVIPEAPFDLDQLAEVLAEDHRLNPSHYAFLIAAEGAIWHGGRLAEYGEPDAYGHRRKVSIGDALVEEITRRTGIESVASELTYDLRSGEADSLDQMVAITYANVAMDLIADGRSGMMVAIRDGHYAVTSLPGPTMGSRKVDVERMYDLERFRPTYSDKLGEPLLLLGMPAGVLA